MTTYAKYADMYKQRLARSQDPNRVSISTRFLYSDLTLSLSCIVGIPVNISSTKRLCIQSTSSEPEQVPCKSAPVFECCYPEPVSYHDPAESGTLSYELIQAHAGCSEQSKNGSNPTASKDGRGQECLHDVPRSTAREGNPSMSQLS